MSGNSDKSKPTRIPVQTQITPEMEQKLEQQALAAEQFYRKLYFFRNIGIVLLVLGLPLVIITYFNTVDRKRLESGSDTVEVPQPLNDFESLLKSGTDLNLEEYSRNQIDKTNSVFLPDRVNSLLERLQVADQLLLNPNQENNSFAIRSKLNCLIKLATINVVNSMNQYDYARQLAEFAQSHFDDENPILRVRAHTGYLVSRIHDCLLDVSDANFELVKAACADFPNDVDVTVLRANHLPSLSTFLARANRPDYVEQFFRELGARFIESENEAVSEFGEEFYDMIIVKKTDLDELRELVWTGRQQLLEQLEELVERIRTSPSASPALFAKVLACIEDLSLAGENELQSKLLASLRSSNACLAHGQPRDEIAQLFVDFDRRQNLVGEMFEIDPADRASNLAADEVKATVVGFFSLGDFENLKVLKQLTTMEYPDKRKIWFLIICTDKLVSSEGREMLNRLEANFPEATAITFPRSQNYARQCFLPDSNVGPYLVVLRKNNEIHSINVKVDQLMEKTTGLLNENVP